MKVRYALYVIAAAMLILAAAPIYANTQFFLEDFESGNVGDDISAIGWTWVSGGTIQVYDTIIDSGKCARTNSFAGLAQYQKALPGGAHTVGSGETLTLIGMVKVFDFEKGYIGVSNGTGWRRVGLYNRKDYQRFYLGELDEAGTEDFTYLDVTLAALPRNVETLLRLDITQNSATAYYSAMSDPNNWHLIGTMTTFFDGNHNAGLSSVSLVDIFGQQYNTYMDTVQLNDYVPQLSYPGRISGTIALEDWSGPASTAPIGVQLTPTAGGAAKTVQISAAGAYTVYGVQPGTYTVTFSTCKWLPQVVSNVVVTAGSTTSGIDASLKNGDVNGSGSVSSADRDIVLKNL